MQQVHVSTVCALKINGTSMNCLLEQKDILYNGFHPISNYELN